MERRKKLLIALTNLDKRKKLLIALTVISVIAISGVALASDSWFNWTPNFSGLEEGDRRMVDNFTLTDLPEYFSAGVFVEGPGYTGQEHSVDILITQNRPHSSTWLASGDYSLDLELGASVVEPITSGSFIDMRNAIPFNAPTYYWTPTSDADTYDIVLSLTNVVWTIATEFTITLSAGTGGSISPSGAVSVVQGDDKTFTITANEGYVIEDILVNEVYIETFDLYVFTHLFENVQENWAIHATFSAIEYTITATAGTGGSIAPPGATAVPYGQSQFYTITPDTEYMIDDVLVDSVSVGAVSSHLFENVITAHTIHATFISTVVNFVGSEFESDVTDFTDSTSVRIDNVELPVVLVSGQEAVTKWNVINTVSTGYSNIKYHIYAQIGEERITLVAWDDWRAVTIPAGAEVTLVDTFTAPTGGTYTLILYIIDASN